MLVSVGLHQGIRDQRAALRAAVILEPHYCVSASVKGGPWAPQYFICEDRGFVFILIHLLFLSDGGLVSLTPFLSCIPQLTIASRQAK